MIILCILFATTFHRFYPTNEGVMVAKTGIRMEVKNDTVFIRAECHSPYGIYTEAVDRDQVKKDEDFFGIILTQNKKSGYFFMVNAQGIKKDGVIVLKSTAKKEWDFVWDASLKRLKDTLWTAELKIPLTEMNFNVSGDSLVIYANFVRGARLEGIGNFEAGSLVPIKGTNFYDLEYTKKFVFFLSTGQKNKLKIFNEPYVAMYHDYKGSYFAAGSDLSF